MKISNIVSYCVNNNSYYNYDNGIQYYIRLALPCDESNVRHIKFTVENISKNCMSDHKLISKLVEHYILYKYRSDSTIKLISFTNSILDNIFRITDIGIICLEYLFG